MRSHVVMHEHNARGSAVYAFCSGLGADSGFEPDTSSMLVGHITKGTGLSSKCTLCPTPVRDRKGINLIGLEKKEKKRCHPCFATDKTAFVDSAEKIERSCLPFITHDTPCGGENKVMSNYDDVCPRLDLGKVNASNIGEQRKERLFWDMGTLGGYNVWIINTYIIHPHNEYRDDEYVIHPHTEYRDDEYIIPTYMSANLILNKGMMNIIQPHTEYRDNDSHTEYRMNT
ncbi:hypothetical protein CEXT_7721 [Caerostris extrusa]|uniref:Uncharacterized protein n=1 Tax=Caerostris extrusa TaxID=172846 RepID=A0AAV4Y350_CAEEX|nr:hypothetical protein CEXT_7721 [Caerostris extrusa]